MPIIDWMFCWGTYFKPFSQLAFIFKPKLIHIFIHCRIGYVKKSATTGISKNNIVVETDFCICEKVIYKIHNCFLKREPSCSIINLHGTENWMFQQFFSIEKFYLAVSKVFSTTRKQNKTNPSRKNCTAV